MKAQTYRTDRKATLIGKNGSAEAVLKNLSNQHAGVLTPRGAQVGTELELVLEIPAHGEFTTLSIDTIVSHRHNLENEIYLKLDFAYLSTEQESAISDFLEYKQRLIDMGKRPTL